MENFSQTVTHIWSITDLLRSDFKHSQYGRVILPFTLLRRLECMLESDKEAVLEAHEKATDMSLTKDAAEKFVFRVTNQKFFNTSPMTLLTLNESDIEDNLEKYVQCFSKEVREIFELFHFEKYVGLLRNADLLYKTVQKFSHFDLSPDRISDNEMGLVFEELINRIVESSSETEGEYFTPRDIARLITSLVLTENVDLLMTADICRTFYDPAAGTGSFLACGIEYVKELNPNAKVHAFGQEINPESVAICKANMLIHGQDANNIKLGNTLSNDLFYSEKFNYMIAHPPFGLDWKNVQNEIRNEHLSKGFEGRFGAGLPRVSDGSMLFLMHLISKLRDTKFGGGRIGIILSGSPLFTGGAGSGESEIRRYILEADLLETIIALPTEMFQNTGIATYIWILSNNKSSKRRGKVQLVNAVNLSSKMRRSLGSKRNYLTDDDIHTINQELNSFDEICEVESSKQKPLVKIFANTDFGYRRITIERPLRLSVQMDDERLAELRFSPGPLKAPMKWIWKHYGQRWNKKDYGELGAVEQDIRIEIKASFSELQEKQVKDLFTRKLWLDQKQLLENAERLRGQLINQVGEAYIVSGQCDDFNHFEGELNKAFKETEIQFDAEQKKQFIDAVSYKNPDAKPVIKKVLKESPHQIYGVFETTLDGENLVVEYEPDIELRDYEDVPLNINETVKKSLEIYYNEEIAPYISDAWIDKTKRDHVDDEIGLIGYSISREMFLEYQDDIENHSSLIELRRLGVTSANLSDSWDLAISKNNSFVYYRDDRDNNISRTIDRNFIFLKVPSNLDPKFIGLIIKSNLADIQRSNYLGINSLSIDRILRHRVERPPSLSVQENIVELNIAISRMGDDLYDFGDRLIKSPEENINKALLYKHWSEKSEQDFIIERAPYFLSEMLFRASNSCISNREKFEILLKYAEYTSAFLCTVLYIRNFSDDAEKQLKKIKRYASFGKWIYMLNLLSKKSCIVSKVAQEIIGKLCAIAEIRNSSYGHGVYPTPKELVDQYQRSKKLVSQVNSVLFDIYHQYTLVEPISCTWDGEFYNNRVRSYNGSSGYPFMIQEIKTKLPLVQERMYFISEGMDDRYELNNFIIRSDVSNGIGIEGFFLFSQENASDGFEFICHQQVPVQKIFSKVVL